MFPSLTSTAQVTKTLVTLGVLCAIDSALLHWIVKIRLLEFMIIALVYSCMLLMGSCCADDPQLISQRYSVTSSRCYMVWHICIFSINCMFSTPCVWIKLYSKHNSSTKSYCPCSYAVKARIFCTNNSVKCSVAGPVVQMSVKIFFCYRE